MNRKMKIKRFGCEKSARYVADNPREFEAEETEETGEGA